jgi:hypothetical protein
MNMPAALKTPTFENLLLGFLHSPAGAVLARPWFDRTALNLLSYWFFPLSRLWAAARAAEGSTSRYLDEISALANATLVRKIDSRLNRFETVRTQVVGSEALWEQSFFGAGPPQGLKLARVEAHRMNLRNQYNSLRRIFATLGQVRKVGPIQWDIPSPDFVDGIYGGHLKNPEEAFAPPRRMPKVELSGAIEHDNSREYWLRFASPSKRLADNVIARVYEPVNVDNPPTLIFGHGICVEFDHWKGLVDEVDEMVRLGIRVIRPEAPWHGRRVPDGRYGGETFMATAPIGALDLFSSAAKEWSVLIDWARRHTDGPVAIGGSSLGAMTSQLIADKARAWPKRLHPDALFLITHCGRIQDAVRDGSLARIWGIEQATAKQGWTPDLVNRFQPLLDTSGKPVVDPKHIVTVLGAYDDVTPFASGKALIERWQVPDENAFIWPRGHFSVPIGMMRDHAPVTRFHQVLTALG